MDRLSPLDAVFVNAEDGITHMHIGSCAVFAGPPPPFDDVVALIASKLPLLPRYRQRCGSCRAVWPTRCGSTTRTSTSGTTSVTRRYPPRGARPSSRT